MSIALPVRRRCPAAKSGWVCRPREWPLSVLPAIVEFVTAPVTILLGASFLKREVQIFGGRLGLPQGAVGSGLAGGDKGEGAGDTGRSDTSAFGHRVGREVIPNPGECQRLGGARHCLRVSSYWIRAFAGMTYKWTLTCLLAARTCSTSNGLRTNCVLLGYGHGYPYFRAHDRGHDRPEHHHHTRDARGESALRRRPIGEAEGRQR
jgi:hypothetical protein